MAESPNKNLESESSETKKQKEPSLVTCRLKNGKLVSLPADNWEAMLEKAEKAFENLDLDGITFR